MVAVWLRRMVTGAMVLLLAGVFGSAAVMKLLRPGAFRAALGALVPARWVRVVAIAVPVMELGLGIWLVSGVALRAAAVASVALLMIFTRVLRIMWRKRIAGCGCFGEQAQTTSTLSGILRNLLLMAAGVVVVVRADEVRLWRGDVSTLLGQVVAVIAVMGLWSVVARSVRRLPARDHGGASSVRG